MLNFFKLGLIKYVLPIIDHDCDLIIIVVIMPFVGANCIVIKKYVGA